MDEEEYAIVSKKEFLALKRELEKIKKNPLEGAEQGDTLQSSIDNLNKSLNTMLEVFKQAAGEMKLEEHDTEMVGKQIGPLNDKLDKLIDQNQKIAKGIVAVADMVREKLDELESAPRRLAPLGPMPTPRAPEPMATQPRPAPDMSGYGAMPPPSQPPPPMGGTGAPPMPDLPPLDAGLPPPGAPSGRDVMSGLMR